MWERVRVEWSPPGPPPPPSRKSTLNPSTVGETTVFVGQGQGNHDREHSSPCLKQKGDRLLPSHLAKIPPNLGAEGAELKVSPSHSWTGQAREGPRESPKDHERQGREGEKGSPPGPTPGELLKRGLRIGGGVSLSLSRDGRKERLPRRHLHASETLGPGTGALTAAPGRRRYLGSGLDRLRSSPPGGVSGLHFRLSAAPDPDLHVRPAPNPPR